jgi:integrase
LQRRTGVKRNPLLAIDLGANDGQVRERVALPDEADDLLAALQHSDRVPFAIALNSGPRRGIIREIDWTDVLVTFDGRKTIGNWLTLRPLQTRRGRGKLREEISIPVAPQLRRVLLTEWEAQGFPAAGKVVTRSVISGRLYKATDKAWGEANKVRRERLGRPLRKRGRREAWSSEHELEPIRLHECRHTYASWLMASRKWSVKEMMLFMGITQLSTWDRYAKIIEAHGPREHQAEVINLFAQEG